MASGIGFGFRAAVPPDTGGKSAEGRGKSSVHCATDMHSSDLTKSLLGRRNDPQVQFPIGWLPPLALDLDPALNLDWVKASAEQEKEQEADLGLSLFSEQNIRFSEFSQYPRICHQFIDSALLACGESLLPPPWLT